MFDSAHALNVLHQLADRVPTADHGGGQPFNYICPSEASKAALSVPAEIGTYYYEDCPEALLSDDYAVTATFGGA